MKPEVPGVRPRAGCGARTSIGVAGRCLRPAVASIYFHQCQGCCLPLWGHELLQLGHPGSQSLSPSELSTSWGWHSATGINYISVTQNDPCPKVEQAMSSERTKPPVHRASVWTPFPGRKSRWQKSVQMVHARQSNGYRHEWGPLEASLLNMVPAISVLGEGQ